MDLMRLHGVVDCKMGPERAMPQLQKNRDLNATGEKQLHATEPELLQSYRLLMDISKRRYAAQGRLWRILWCTRIVRFGPCGGPLLGGVRSPSQNELDPTTLA